jgi:5-methylcytosine-specific restriction endonuclease McrA
MAPKTKSQIGLKAIQNSEDERLQRWMEWYDRQSTRNDLIRRNTLPKRAFARLAREEIESLFRGRIREGWSSPVRKKHQAVQGYRDLVISLLIERDGRACGLCHHEVPLGEETIDHIIQKSKGGKDEAGNIRLACKTCNNRRPRKYEQESPSLLN